MARTPQGKEVLRRQKNYYAKLERLKNYGCSRPSSCPWSSAFPWNAPLLLPACQKGGHLI
ncbi:MAG: hypothetical protein A4E58_01172 [Syntrophorhabdus sp. PtaB.Bin006]|nr:MAG: hypothetical protein A4E58_01172 [Syntrophorhabdus sp. PtaB.Bin006]